MQEASATAEYTIFYFVLNHPVSSTDPLGRTTTSVYDRRGIPLTSTDRNGNLTTYTYDGLGRLLSTVTTKGAQTESIQYTYDYLGNVTQMTDSGGTTTYTYDDFGTLTGETRGTVSKTYAYDANGNRTLMEVENDSVVLHTVAYEYDYNNRLVGVTASLLGPNGMESDHTLYQYDANGNLTYDRTLGKGFIANKSFYTYNQANLLIEQKSYVQNTLRDTYLLGYQLDGNLVSRTRNGATTTYTYDKANRLQSETADGVTTTYAYDLRGNRTRKTVGTDVTTYTSNLANQLLSEGGTTYQYDANGNLTSKSGAENESYTYDLLGRLKSYSGIGGSASYTYDGGGLRQTKTLGTTTTQYIWDGNNLISENWGSDQRQYIYGRRLISMYTPGADQREYYQYDEHGSVTSLYNLVGRCHADYTYDAFGNQSEGGAFYNPFRYSGEYTDAESGMVYLRARYYDPSVGRFISEDPAKDGGNWYAYCANNPVIC